MRGTMGAAGSRKYECKNSRKNECEELWELRKVKVKLQVKLQAQVKVKCKECKECERKAG